MFQRKCWSYKIDGRIFLECLKLFQIQAFGFFCAVFVEYVSHTGLVAVAPVAIFVEPVFQCFSSTVKVLFWKEVKYFPTRMGIACSATSYQYSESSLAILDSCL